MSEFDVRQGTHTKPMTTDIPEESSGTRIPERPDFPVDWDDETEPSLLWSWDNFHSPLPRTPMTTSVGKFVGTGSKEASKYLGTYQTGGRSKIVSGYPYGASTAPPMTEEEKADRTRKIDAEMKTVRANWDTGWLPELEADLEEMKAAPYADLTPDALWKTVEKALALHSRHWNIHNRIVTPVIEQSNRLDRICGEILGAPDDSVAPVLLHGAETLTVKSIKNLETLADRARSDDQLCNVLERDAASAETIDALKQFEAGKEWLRDLESYLHEFGYRCTGFDLSFPTWVEDQTFVLQIVRNLLASSGSDTSTETSRESQLDSERDALLAKVRDAARQNPELLKQFEYDYELGQQIWPLIEDHSHYIDQASTAIVRIAIAEVGRRLQSSSAIEQADDVWYLDLDEAKAALLEESKKKPGDLKSLVSGRRADRVRYSKITPPRYLGAFPPDHEEAAEPGRPAETPGTLRGSAASKGEASGIARVVLSPDDFHKVSKGDVLVCRSTAPMWTPLFRIISALVSEAGGVLSHPAVVAREFNLPAVVGVPDATNLITDGQPVNVSGTDGLVHTN